MHQRLGDTSGQIMDCADEAAVRKAIENDRQSVRQAKESSQLASGKEAGEFITQHNQQIQSFPYNTPY